MSTPIEIAAVVLGLIYLVLVIREQRVGWIAGGLASALFLFVFWHAGLPGQGLLQVYYVGVAIHGWLYWGREDGVAVSRLGFRGNAISVVVLVALCAITLLLRDDGNTTTALLDTATSWGGVIATWLVASKRCRSLDLVGGYRPSLHSAVSAGRPSGILRSIRPLHSPRGLWTMGMASQQSEGYDNDDLTRACEALAKVLRLRDAPQLIQSFDEGLSNHSFLVGLDDEQWVVRCPAGAPALGTDFSREIRIHQRASDAGLAPRIVYADAESRVLCTEFVESRGDTHNPKAIAELLRGIHRLPSEGPALHPRERLSLFLSELPDGNPARRFIDSHGETLRHAEHFVSPNEHSVQCHNDLLRANRLVTDDRLLAIDWEYACAGDPFFDLAAVASELNDEERNSLLTTYLNREPKVAELQRYFAHGVYYLAISHLWMARYTPEHFYEEVMASELAMQAKRLGVAVTAQTWHILGAGAMGTLVHHLCKSNGVQSELPSSSRQRRTLEPSFRTTSAPTMSLGR